MRFLNIKLLLKVLFLLGQISIISSELLHLCLGCLQVISQHANVILFSPMVEQFQVHRLHLGLQGLRLLDVVFQLGLQFWEVLLAEV